MNAHNLILACRLNLVEKKEEKLVVLNDKHF